MDEMLGAFRQGIRARGAQLQFQGIGPVFILHQGGEAQRQVAHVGMLVINGVGSLLLRGVHELGQVQPPLLAEVGRTVHAHEPARQEEEAFVPPSTVPSMPEKVWLRDVVPDIQAKRTPLV